MGLEAYHSVILLFWVLCAIFIAREYKKASLIKDRSEKKYLCATLFVLCTGIICRTIYPSYPFGVFVDEAIGGYDAWCLANYGVDSHLTSFPVYLKSWGSGQSAAYVYCATPFVKLFGLSVPVFRLPMAFISCLSLLFFYYTLRKANISKTLLFLIIFLFTISPWHLMSSRWGLDCNLSPHFMLMAAGAFFLTLESPNAKSRFNYALLGSFMLVATAYSYGISWFMLPLFCLLIYWYLYRTKKLTLKQLMLCGLFIFVLLIPLACFAVVLLFDLEEFKLGFITITQLEFTRGGETSWLSHQDPFWTFVYYVHKGIVLLFWGDDLLAWNSFPYWGQFYNIIAIPFILVAIYSYIRKNITHLDAIFILWTLSLFFIIILIDPNANHWNFLWFPLLYFFAKGIYIAGQKFKKLYTLLYPILAVLAISFGFYYSTFYKTSSFARTNEYGFIKGVDEILPFVNQLSVDTVYNMSPKAPSFPFFLFYDPISPYIYDASKKFVGDDRTIRYDYDKYYHDYSKKIEPLEKTAYVLPISEISHMRLDNFKSIKESIFLYYGTSNGLNLINIFAP